MLSDDEFVRNTTVLMVKFVCQRRVDIVTSVLMFAYKRKKIFMQETGILLS